MVPKETHRERIDRIEALLPTVLVEIEALRILFGLIIDFDFIRTADTTSQPLLFEVQAALEDMLAEIDTDTEDVSEQIRLSAICSAMLIADRGESEVVDIEVDDGETAANDD